MGNLGTPELVIVLVVVLVIFGPTKLPGLARSLGQSMSEFRRGRDEGAAADPDLTYDESSDR